MKKEKAIKCKNCSSQVKGNFCSQCGQTAKTHRLNFHFLWNDIQYGIFQVDKGLLFTVKELYSRPGHTIREFLTGKRVNHFKPLSMLIVLASLYGFIIHFLQIKMTGQLELSPETGKTLLVEEINEWLSLHYAWFSLLTVPVFALSSYLCFFRRGYNFIEHFVLNTFATNQRLILHFLFIPILYYLSESSYFSYYTRSVLALDFLLIYWTFRQFFTGLNKWKTLLLSLASFLLYLTMALSLFALFIVLFF